MTILLIAGLVVAQFITVAVLLVLPPPRPPVYRMGEIATALRGGSLDASFGAPLVRETVSETPARLEPICSSDGDRDDLAVLLGAPAWAVRFQNYRAQYGNRIVPLMLAPWRPRADLANGRANAPSTQTPGPTWRSAPSIAPTPSCSGAVRDDPVHAQERLVMGDFVAAVRLGPSRWVTVEPALRTFPNYWQRRVLLCLAASLAVVLPIGGLFIRRITAPLGAFAVAADRFGKDPGAPSITLRGPAEIGVAARAFNEMQTRLKRYVADRTAMVGAISHDLRTPLTRMRFRLERAPTELKTAILSDVAQMEEMIHAVLDFIREGSARRVREPIELLSLLECTIDDATATGAAAAILTTTGAVVDGDAPALQRLFANLVDNAIKYGACAKISVHDRGPDVVVDITDEGPGLSSAEMAQVFEPFYRGDASRNLDAGGIGLGLAIARSIAREHGGDLRLMSDACGLTARVQLPRSIDGFPSRSASFPRREIIDPAA